MSGPRARRYRFFSWDHGHFSGKVGILDACERAHPEPRAIPGAATPRQRLASHLIELLAGCQLEKRAGRLFAAPAAARAGRA